MVSPVKTKTGWPAVVRADKRTAAVFRTMTAVAKVRACMDEIADAQLTCCLQ